MNGSGAAVRPTIRVLKLRGYPILHQLELEEKLLRLSEENWCVINDGSSRPAIVMGISGKPEKLFDVRAVLKNGIDVIKRFSGGGTVVVDEDTVFVTLIASRSAIPRLELYPRHIMQWTEQFYSPVFKDIPGFQLREHDYVFKDRKFGGNAQSITKDRWLHHTSFLWDYKNSHMAYLKLPERAPEYRSGRPHSDFICRLRDILQSRDHLTDAMARALERFFLPEEVQIDDVLAHLSIAKYPHSTKLLTVNDLQLFS